MQKFRISMAGHWQNFRIRHRNTDYRPWVVADDVTDLRIRELQSIGSASSVLVQAIESNKILLEGREVNNTVLPEETDIIQKTKTF